jgi:hypothetical protein
MTDSEKRAELKRKLMEAKEAALIRRQAGKAIKLHEKKNARKKPLHKLQRFQNP